MKLNKKIMVLLLIMLATHVQAQVIDDLDARTSSTLKYKIDKKWSVAGTYFIYVDHNISEYDKSELGIELEYKANSWLELGIDYRYSLKSKGNAHDIRYSATFDYPPSTKWKITYRTQFQQEFISLKEEMLKKNPMEHNLRNKLTVSYGLTKNVELYLFTENYLQLLNSDLLFNCQKSGMGAEFEIKERNKIETRFEIKNKRSKKNDARIILGYTYTFGYGKQKNK